VNAVFADVSRDCIPVAEWMMEELVGRAAEIMACTLQ